MATLLDQHQPGRGIADPTVLACMEWGFLAVIESLAVSVIDQGPGQGRIATLDLAEAVRLQAE